MLSLASRLIHGGQRKCMCTKVYVGMFRTSFLVHPVQTNCQKDLTSEALQRGWLYSNFVRLCLFVHPLQATACTHHYIILLWLCSIVLTLRDQLSAETASASPCPKLVCERKECCSCLTSWKNAQVARTKGVYRKVAKP